MWKNLISNGLNLLFPQFCFGCQKEGSYLCSDCQSTLEISEYQYCLCEKPLRLPNSGKCRRCRHRKLNGLYSGLPYQNRLVQKLIHQFKYKPYIKDLAETLSSLIITHFLLIEKSFKEAEFILIPIPLDKRKIRQRGFNQAEEIAKELSSSLKLPLVSDCLIKIRETLPQVELSDKEREENIKGAFLCKNPEKIYPVREFKKLGCTKDIDFSNRVKGQKILLVDDVYTTGATMEEAARVLKKAGAKEVWGVVVARG